MKILLILICLLNSKILFAQDLGASLEVFEKTKNLKYNDSLRILDLEIKVYKTKIDSVECYIVDRQETDGTYYRGVFVKKQFGYIYHNFEQGTNSNGFNYVSMIGKDSVINLVLNSGNVVFLSLFEKGYKNWHGSDYLANQTVSFDRIEEDLNKKDLLNTLHKSFTFLSKGIRTFEEIKKRCL